MRLEFLIPGAVPSTPNLREHWAAKARRVKKQREQSRLLARLNAGLTFSADVMAFGGTVTMTRHSPRKLDSDNLAGSLKATRDGIASALGVNDGDPRVTWRCEQARCRDGEQQIRVTVEVARPATEPACPKCGGLGGTHRRKLSGW